MWTYCSTSRTSIEPRPDRRWPSTATLLFAVLLLVGGVTESWALDPCQVCHANAGLALDGKSQWIHNDSFLEGVHGNLSCDDCHKGIKGFPHAVENEVRCDLPCHVAGAGHEAINETEAGSVHAVAVLPSGPSCIGCHAGGATLRGIEADALCRSCHLGLDPQRGLYPDSPGAFAQRAHRSVGEDQVAPGCGDCHGHHGIQPGQMARSACQKEGCHPGEGPEFGALFDHGNRPRRSPWGGAAPVVLVLGLFMGLVLAAHALRGE